MTTQFILDEETKTGIIGRDCLGCGGLLSYKDIVEYRVYCEKCRGKK